MIQWKDIVAAESFLNSEEAELRLELQAWLSEKRDCHKFVAGLCCLIDMEKANLLNRVGSSDSSLSTQDLKSRLDQLRKMKALIEALLPQDRKGAFIHERRIRSATAV